MSLADPPGQALIQVKPGPARDESGIPPRLALATTGFAVRVSLPAACPGAPESTIVVDEPVASVHELRAAVAKRLPEAGEWLADPQVNVAVNGAMILSGEAAAPVRSGDRVALVPAIAGG